MKSKFSLILGQLNRALNNPVQRVMEVKVMRASVTPLFTHVISCYCIQVMFEKYQFEGVYIAIQAVLTLYAQGEA